GRGQQKGAMITDVMFVTTDGGKTWKNVLTPNPNKRVQGDDGLTFSRDGICYHSHLSFEGLRHPRPKKASSAIAIGASFDGGLTWQNSVPAVDHINTYIPMEDKPYVVVNNIPQHANQGQLYVSWTRFDNYESTKPGDSTQIYFSRSLDSGKTFSMPIRISDQGGDCMDGDNTVEGAVPAVGTNGNIYIAWSGPRGLEFDKSTDGGLTFGTDKIIDKQYGGWDFDVDGVFRANGMPITAVDQSDGPNSGTIYVNWVDDRNGDLDVFVTSSRDSGEHWSKAVRVNDDKLKNGAVQFFTWMAVDPVDGSVNVVFYDRRNLDSTKTGVTMARSVDGGKTFKNFPIDVLPFYCTKRAFFGDYNGIAAFNGTVAPIFTHFVSETKLGVSVALFHFKTGTVQTIP
ncbi:MAG: sialidase family protein, partial [Bacteroidota bacterium]|nr:sialidase family protein [Bacteroidota bacterium]